MKRVILTVLTFAVFTSTDQKKAQGALPLAVSAAAACMESGVCPLISATLLMKVFEQITIDMGVKEIQGLFKKNTGLNDPDIQPMADLVKPAPKQPNSWYEIHGIYNYHTKEGVKMPVTFPDHLRRRFPDPKSCSDAIKFEIQAKTNFSRLSSSKGFYDISLFCLSRP